MKKTDEDISSGSSPIASHPPLHDSTNVSLFVPSARCSDVYLVHLEPRGSHAHRLSKAFWTRGSYIQDFEFRTYSEVSHGIRLFFYSRPEACKPCLSCQDRPISELLQTRVTTCHHGFNSFPSTSRSAQPLGAVLLWRGKVKSLDHHARRLRPEYYSRPARFPLAGDPEHGSLASNQAPVRFLDLWIAILLASRGSFQAGRRGKQASHRPRSCE